MESSKDNKIGKSIKLEPSILELVEGYRGVSKESFTGAVETLIFKGLENVNTTQIISKTVKDELRSIKQEQAKHTDRIVSVLIGIARILGRIYAHSFSTVKQVKSFENEQVKELENHGIKKAMEDLKAKKEVDDNE